ncbi:Extracellular ligand-binding receptor (modular protein) [Magnetospirillum sp. LM-5]|nr:Extracellular ligand-binding receptor (modular protein) [Magnetospirillum sp. LM-5]
MLGIADGQAALDVADVGSRRQLGGQETLIIVPVMGDDLQQKVGLAGQHVALAHLGPGQHQLLECLEIGLGLAVQADMGENGDVEAQGVRLDLGVVAADIARLFQGADTAKAGRCGNAGTPRQFDVGHPTVGLQIRQDSAVDPVELDPLHSRDSKRTVFHEIILPSLRASAKPAIPPTRTIPTWPGKGCFGGKVYPIRGWEPLYNHSILCNRRDPARLSSLNSLNPILHMETEGCPTPSIR